LAGRQRDFRKGLACTQEKAGEKTREAQEDCTKEKEKITQVIVKQNEVLILFGTDEVLGGKWCTSYYVRALPYSLLEAACKSSYFVNAQLLGS
jgi:hypothetical protein